MGRKKWTIFSPTSWRSLYPSLPPHNNMDYFSLIEMIDTLIHPFIQTITNRNLLTPSLLKAELRYPASFNAVIFNLQDKIIVHPGDLLYVPRIFPLYPSSYPLLTPLLAYWFHSVESLDLAISLRLSLSVAYCPPPPHKDEMKPFLYSVVSPSEEDLLWNYLRGSWLEHNPFASSKEWSQKRRIGITSIYLDLLVGRSISPPQGFTRTTAAHFIKSELLTTRYAFLLDKLLVIHQTLCVTTLD